MRDKVTFLLLLLSIVGMQTFAQVPGVSVRFANPQFDCETQTYCLDVEFLSDTPNTEVFGMNVRFYYETDVMEFIEMGDFQGGYGPFSPNPPLIESFPTAGSLFTLGGGITFINGAIQLQNTGVPPIYLSDTEWTKLFNVCFVVTSPVALNNDNFCPSVIWDMEKDPSQGGFQAGSNGVVITAAQANRIDSRPTEESVVQFNWEYSETGASPFGAPVQAECLSTICSEDEPEITLTKTADPLEYFAVGDIISYSITVTNSGNTPLNNVLVTDPLTGLNQLIAILEESQQIVFTETHAITQADMDAGVVVNTASVVGFDPENNMVEDSDEAVVTTERQPNLSIVKSAQPTSYRQAGDVISYTIIVENTGNVSLSNVVVSDPLIDLSETIATLLPGQSQTLTGSYTVVASDIQSGSVLNTATAEGQDPDGSTVSDADDALVEFLAEGRPELVVTKSTESNLVLGGDMVTFVMTVTNFGTATAQNVVVTDLLSEDFTFISASHDGMFDGQTRIISWEFGDLEAGENIIYEITVMVNHGLEPSTIIRNQIFADADNIDQPAASCVAKVTLIGEADMSIAKSANLSFAFPGDQVAYTLVVTNNGPSVARNIRITDYLPPEAIFVGASFNGSYNSQSHSIDWVIEAMESGTSLDLTIEVLIDENAQEERPIMNYASVISDTNDPNPLNNTAIHLLPVTGPRANLAILKSATENAVPAGNNILYRIELRNYGPNDAQNVLVVDSLPEEVTFVDANENGHYDPVSHSVTWHFDLLLNGELIMLELTTRINGNTAGGTVLRNRIAVESSTTDPDLSNNRDTADVTVETPDLFIPDVFSPNNDGINDTFVIRGLDNYPDNSIIIINRWGNKVFEAAPYNNDWDGTNQFGITIGGNQLPVGTYYYILDLGESGNSPIRGFIYLTR